MVERRGYPPRLLRCKRSVFVSYSRPIKGYYYTDICIWRNITYCANYRSSTMAKTKVSCLNCQQEVYIENKEIARGFGKFCSRKCSGAYKSKNVKPKDPNVECAQCHKTFYKCFYKRNIPKSGLHFCNRKCKDKAQRIGGIREIMPFHYGTTDKNYRYKIFILSGKPKICERCNYDKNEAAIIVHHKDRNRDNNDISNLEVLCCNCHAIEHWSD
jgi:HNH endonuclease